MEGSPPTLVVSPHLESQRTLFHILEDLKVTAFASANLAEAAQVLSRNEIALVFCEDRLTDGTYRDLLQNLETWNQSAHTVVTTRIGEWEEYLEALALGAFDMLQRPYRSTEVELNVLRAMHGKSRKSGRAAA
jgi:DNA-binding NtrC family response regulator